MCDDLFYALSAEDRQAYEHLRESFAKKQTSLKRDRHVNSFSQELRHIVAFVERRPEGRELRAVNAGLMFNGTFICVNTKLLKILISRCKSSINSSLQQLGYSSLKNKAKAHECLISSISILKGNLELAKQWTVRYSIAPLCFPFFSTPVTCAVRPVPPPIPAISQMQNQEKKVIEKVMPPMPILNRSSPLVLPMVNLPCKKEQTNQEKTVEIIDQEIDWNTTSGFVDDYGLNSKVQEVDWDFSTINVW